MGQYPQVLAVPVGDPIALAWQEDEGALVKEVTIAMSTQAWAMFLSSMAILLDHLCTPWSGRSQPSSHRG
jgi:hypothetical protein